MNPRENTAGVEKVGIAEIAELCRQLRELSRPADPDRPATAQADARTAFLTRKADLVARLAAAHPDPATPAPSPTDGGPV